MCVYVWFVVDRPGMKLYASQSRYGNSGPDASLAKKWTVAWMNEYDDVNAPG